MHRFLRLLLSLLFFSRSLCGQQTNQGKDYASIYRHAEKMFNAANATALTDSAALLYYLQAARILEQRKIVNDTLMDCWLKCGILLMSGSNPQRAMPYFLQVINLIHQNKILPDSLLFKPYLFAGSVQYALNNLDSAEYYYKKAEYVYDAHQGLSESERLFNKFGALYFETGDYNKSITYFEKALGQVLNRSPVNVFFVVNYKNNIATAQMKLGRYEQALQTFTELLSYGKPPDELLYNMGNTYFEMGNYALALTYINRIRMMDFEKYNSLIKIFIRIHSYDSAGYYISKAKQVYKANRGFGSKLTYGMILKYSGDLESATGNIPNALRDYQLALLALDPEFTDTAVSSNPVSFSGLQNFLFLFETLVSKANALHSLYNRNSEILFLEQSVQTYSSALLLVKHIERTYFSDDARLFLKAKVSPATQDAVDIALQLYEKTKDKAYINLAFGFVENNKATVLQAGLKNLELSSISGLPAGLVAEEKRLRTALAKLSIMSLRHFDSLTSAKLFEEIHELEISLASVQNKLDENPLYHRLKFGISVINTDSIRIKMNGADEALLSFYYTSNRLICFYILKSEAGFTTIPFNPSLLESVKKLREELAVPQASGSGALRLEGEHLFKQLIQPVFEHVRNMKKLMIIPYNEISYVPFEMLINPANGSLMLEDFSISYNYSAAFLFDKPGNRSTKYNVLAMAPFAGKNENLVLPALPASLDEIKWLPGKILSGSNATKSQFENLSAQFPVVHLATHAVANDANMLGSYIAFYGLKDQPDSLHRLYEREIYTLDLKSANLVILSACETGNGLLVNGEGIMSLSRAFSYAGCQSVVTSLWKADELSTAFITKQLHHYLQKGFAIDEALQQAKIDYLESNEVDARYKNPAYWAHLVLIGNIDPITKPANNWPTEVALVIFSILITFWAIKKARHKNMPGKFYRIHITDEG